MQRTTLLASLLAIGVLESSASLAQTPTPASASRVRHALHVTLDPGRGWLAVTDTMTIPAAAASGGEAQFLLHSALKVSASQPAITKLPLRPASKDAGAKADAERFFGINASTGGSRRRREARALSGRLAPERRHRDPPLRGALQLRPRRRERTVHAWIPLHRRRRRARKGSTWPARASGTRISIAT